jgi:hypothetical protein
MRAIICENDAAMDSLLQPPSATAFDAVSSLLSAAIYTLVGLAALAQAPRDARVRVFLLVALASVAPYCVTAMIWQRGSQVLMSKAVIVTVALSLMINALALLHFAQIFPWRRPWIRRHGAWLWGGYAGVLLIAALVAFLAPSFDVSGDVGSGGVGAVSAELAETLVVLTLLVGLPVLFVLGLATPFAGLVSLYKSWQTARDHQVQSARVTTYWMLISQMGGGVMTILIVPLLRLVAPRGPWVTIGAAILFAFSLLMPIAFAAGVWRYRILDLDAETLPQ